MYGHKKVGDVSQNSGGGNCHFGLNSGATMTVFEYNPNGGKDSSEADALDITIVVGGREFKNRYFPVGKVFREGKGADGNKLEGEITDTNSKEYEDAVKRESDRFSALITDIVSCFVDEEDLETALASGFSSFKDYIQTLERLVKSNSNWQTQLVDVFLPYQWSIKGDNERTYLEFPSKPKAIIHGSVMCKSLGTGFKKDETYEGIRYVNENGDEHPIKRSEWYAGSAFANVTKLEGASQEQSTMNSNSGTGTDW